MSQVLIDSLELEELRDDAQFARDVVQALEHFKGEPPDPSEVVAIIHLAMIKLAGRTTLREIKGKF